MGEISPNYFAAPEAPERIASDIPGCRIICTLRDPVDRLYSFYRLMRHNGWTRATMAELAESVTPATEGSRYAHYLGRWRERFGAERVLVALYDDLESAPQHFLDTICGFIGIAPIPLAGSPLLGKRVNSVTRGPRVALLAEQAWRLRRWLQKHKAASRDHAAAQGRRMALQLSRRRRVRSARSRARPAAARTLPARGRSARRGCSDAICRCGKSLEEQEMRGPRCDRCAASSGICRPQSHRPTARRRRPRGVRKVVSLRILVSNKRPRTLLVV